MLNIRLSLFLAPFLLFRGRCWSGRSETRSTSRWCSAPSFSGRATTLTSSTARPRGKCYVCHLLAWVCIYLWHVLRYRTAFCWLASSCCTDVLVRYPVWYYLFLELGPYCSTTKYEHTFTLNRGNKLNKKQDKTPNKKQENQPRLNFLFENGHVLY